MYSRNVQVHEVGCYATEDKKQIRTFSTWINDTERLTLREVLYIVEINSYSQSLIKFLLKKNGAEEGGIITYYTIIYEHLYQADLSHESEGAKL